MQQQGKLEVVSPTEADVVLPVVLVDKLADEVPRPPPITDGDEEAILARYRFCIDSRATNQLELREMNGRWVFIAPKQADLVSSPAHAPYQYQTGGYELLPRMPATARYFARVDIKTPSTESISTRLSAACSVSKSSTGTLDVPSSIG